MIVNRPNILLILSDEHSFRFQGHVPASEGGEEVATPTLDALAAQGTVFTDAYCAAPLCVPSRIALLTGKEAQLSGACDNGSYLDPALDTFPKALARAGYATCLVGKMHFKGSNQFHGYGHRPYGDLCGYGSHQYEHAIPLRPGDLKLGDGPGELPQDPANAMGAAMEVRTAEAGLSKIPESQCVDSIIASETLAYLREHRASKPGQPWMLTASFVRPHFPLTCPERFLRAFPPDTISEPKVSASGASYDHPVSAAIRDKFKVARIDHGEMMKARATYFANVAYLDEILGDLLDRLSASGLLENTIIIYASDHGEMAGEHGTWWKSGWYEACTRVPLIVSTPAQRAQQQTAVRISTPASLLDLAPTITALAQADHVGGSGCDLSGVIIGDADAPERSVICDHLNNRWGHGTAFRAIRRGPYKLVRFHDAPPLFFNLADDPDEQKNLFEVASGAARAFRDQLMAELEESLDFSKALEQQDKRQTVLRQKYPLISARYLPNQYQLRSGRVIEADQTLYFQGLVTDEPSAFFSDYPGDTNDA